MVAAKLAAWQFGQNQYTRGSASLPTQSDAARMLNVSERSVRSAVEVRRTAISEIVAAVEQGAVSVSKAVLVARLPEARQHSVVSQLGNGKAVSTIVLAASRMERAAVIELAASNCPLSALGRTYPVIYADPPWHFELYSDGGSAKTADQRYPTMLLPDICALPVADIAATHSVLFMWAVSAMFPEALEVVRAWGFTFKTFAVWVKPNISMGHWFRGQHEPLIVATRGEMPPPPSLHSSVFAGSTSGRHSEKPVSVRDWISAAYPHAGKIELFHRGAAPPGWTTWGNQAQAAA
jgi:N6-adenosine-specific RNA methylase IME4